MSFWDMQCARVCVSRCFAVQTKSSVIHSITINEDSTHHSVICSLITCQTNKRCKDEIADDVRYSATIHLLALLRLHVHHLQDVFCEYSNHRLSCDITCNSSPVASFTELLGRIINTVVDKKGILWFLA